MARRNRKQKSPNTRHTTPKKQGAPSQLKILQEAGVWMKRDKLMTALALPIIAVVFVTLYSSVFDEKLNLSGDNLNYYFLAKNLAERGTYALYYDVQQNLPQFFTYFAGLPTTGFRRTPNDEELIRGLRESGATYLVIDQLGFSDTQSYLVPAVQNNPRLFTFLTKTDPPENFFIRINDSH